MAFLIGAGVFVFVMLRFVPQLPILQKSFSKMPPVFFDGLLLAMSSFLTAFLTYLATEEAYKYVLPTLLFWMKVFIGSTSSSIQAIVAYRNQQYSKHLIQTAANASGVAQVTEPNKTPPPIHPASPQPNDSGQV